jgi:hypothetical protein
MLTSSEIKAAVLQGTEAADLQEPDRTVIGWQGMRCVLPPDWNVTSFSMDRDNGYLRIDAPGDSALTVQIRWSSAQKPRQAVNTPYSYMASYVRSRFRKPEPIEPGRVDLKANLEKMLQETAKQARKAKAAFDSSIKPEKIEGESGERTAINFSWSGAGRGQGKIWHCATCNRVVVAQVVGLNRDSAALAQVASQLFATLEDHSADGYDRWALYDLQIDLPSDFRLQEQKLLSGYLQLMLTRRGERILVDRWGLANVALKKFSLEDWFRARAAVRLNGMSATTRQTGAGHSACYFAGRLSLMDRLRNARAARSSLFSLADGYEAGVWQCETSNKLYAVQVFHKRHTSGLWQEIADRCRCHDIEGR